MKVKNLLAVFVGVAVVVSTSISVLANEKHVFSSENLNFQMGEWNESNRNTQLAMPNSEPRYEDSEITSRALTIRVNINNPLEDDWRSTYSSYYYEANRIIEKVDDFLSDEFGIDFYTLSQPHWSFSTTKTGKAAATAAIEYVAENYGLGNADMMIAFTGPIADVSGSACFGVTTSALPFCLVFDHAYNQNCKSTQHEVGHAYGLTECYGTSNCVMKQGADTAWNWFENLCSGHRNAWDSVKNTYGA